MRRTTWISLGLFAAWAAHDAEELATLAATSRELARRAPAWWPLPDDVRRAGLTQAEVNTAIGLMAAVVAGAAADGVRTDGRSAFFQTGLQLFGWHGIGHLAQSALARRYLSGTATSPVVVIPFWLWARRELARDGVPLRRVSLAAMAWLYPLILATIGAAHALHGRRDRS